MIEYPQEAGYPFGTNFSVTYYMMQMHYNNPQRIMSIKPCSIFILQRHDTYRITFRSD